MVDFLREWKKHLRIGTTWQLEVPWTRVHDDNRVGMNHPLMAHYPLLENQAGKGACTLHMTPLIRLILIWKDNLHHAWHAPLYLNTVRSNFFPGPIEKVVSRKRESCILIAWPTTRRAVLSALPCYWRQYLVTVKRQPISFKVGFPRQTGMSKWTVPDIPSRRWEYTYPPTTRKPRSHRTCKPFCDEDMLTWSYDILT